MKHKEALEQSQNNITLVFKHWVVIEPWPHQSFHTKVLCKCKCGKEKPVDTSSLLQGLSGSCRRCSTMEGKNSAHPLYQTWFSMKQRCLSPRNINYPRYGGRGIKVCARWLSSFEAFVADVYSTCTPGKELDRIDNNGDYEPSNVRWVTPAENCQNTSRKTNTGELHIRHRPDRVDHPYELRQTLAGRAISKSFKSLEDAIKTRNKNYTYVKTL